MLIWGKWEEEYFLQKVWTGQITLKAFGNFLSARISNLPAFSAAGEIASKSRTSQIGKPWNTRPRDEERHQLNIPENNNAARAEYDRSAALGSHRGP
jgi:hypothetical protein